MDNHIFRSALNGFNRQDVMEYIERTQKEAAENVEQMEAELQAVRQELTEVRQLLEDCENAKDAVSGELSEVTERCQTARTNWEEQAAAAAALRTEVQQRDTAVRELMVENQTLHCRVQELEDAALAARREKERVTQLELEARERAAAIIAQAEEEAKRLVDEAQADSDAMLRKAQSEADSIHEAALAQVEETVDSYKAMFTAFETTASHVTAELRKMEVTATQLPLNFDHLRQGLENVLEQAKK